MRLSSKSDSVTRTISDIEPATRRPVLLVLAGLGLFVTALDAYVVVTLLPAMFADVGLTIDRFEQATPIVTGFLGGYVIAMPLLGAYSDVRGRAPVYAFCMLIFAAGSAMGAHDSTLEGSRPLWTKTDRCPPRPRPWTPAMARVWPPRGRKTLKLLRLS